jgi:hypothetical protein
MKYYTYITINNLDTSKCYIGVSYKLIESGYKGSGKYIIKALKKYSEENFTRSDLGIFNYLDEANYWEGFYIKMYKTEVKYGGYNLSPKGGHKYKGGLAEETKRKIGEANKISQIGNKNAEGTIHSEESKQKNRESRKNQLNNNKGKHWKISEEGRQNMKQPRSEEHKKNISNGMKGKNIWTKGKPSWIKGLNRSDPRVNSIFETKKNKKLSNL